MSGRLTYGVKSLKCLGDICPRTRASWHRMSGHMRCALSRTNLGQNYNYGTSHYKLQIFRLSVCKFIFDLSAFQHFNARCQRNRRFCDPCPWDFYSRPMKYGAIIFLPCGYYLLWSPYVIGKPYIFSSCDFYLSIFLMVALCNKADHNIFMLFLSSSSSSSSFFPRLISAVGDWMFTILWHMVWP